MTAHPHRPTLNLDQYRDNITATSDLLVLQLEQDNTRLKLVVAELLIKNQCLRWKLQKEQLER